MQSYITVESVSSSEFTEKKSRFIATVAHCSTEEEATAFLSKMRTEYWDAKHNVYAYILRDGTARFSDDGEPHGTAGKPVLDVLVGSGITDAIVVVTRYFGGILLGTGGLVRAYSASAKLGIKASKAVEMCPCVASEINCPYNLHARLSALITEMGGSVTSEEFTDSVKVCFSFKEPDLEPFEEALRERFSAQLRNTRKELKFSAFPIKTEEF